MATIVISCPVCLQKIRAPQAVLGRQIKCPQCKNSFAAADPNAISAEPFAFAGENEPAAPRVDPLGLEGDAEDPVAEEAGAGSALLDFLLFRRMVTPIIVTALFYFGVALILLSGLCFAVLALTGIGSATGVLATLVLLLFDAVGSVMAIVLWRVGCEAILVLFRILDELKRLKT